MSFRTIWRALLPLPLLGVWLLSATAANAMFLTADPIGTKDDPNLYLYVGLDPVNKIDPTGLAGCGTQGSNNRQALSSSECSAWQSKQGQGLRDIASTRAGLAAWQRDPNSSAGRAFARAMTNSFGEGALSEGNIGKLTGALNNLEGFYRDPGTARGGRYDVYKATGWSDGGTIRGGQVAYGADFFSRPTMSEFSRRGTVHEPLHLFGFGDRRASRDGGFPYPVAGREFDMWFADSNPSGATRNADNWACMIAQSCN